MLDWTSWLPWELLGHSAGRGGGFCLVSSNSRSEEMREYGGWEGSRQEGALSYGGV